MLTKNFYSYMRAVFQDTSAEFVKTDGTATSKTYYNADNPFVVMKNWAASISTAGVSFGTGATPATASDYVLESILDNTKINVSVPSAVSYSRGDTYDEYSVSFGVTNKTTETITISEVGLTAAPYYSSGSTSVYVLVDRTVLDTPVTIPAGQSKQITYTIRFNY